MEAKLASNYYWYLFGDLQDLSLSTPPLIVPLLCSLGVLLGLIALASVLPTRSCNTSLGGVHRVTRSPLLPLGTGEHSTVSSFDPEDIVVSSTYVCSAY